MKSFTELAKSRYSVKSFSPQKVEEAALRKILEAGHIAPTAKNAQPQRIYVLRSEEALRKANELTPCIYGATTVLMIAYNTEEPYHYPDQPERDSGAEDCAIVATHMMLEAEELGIASCWVNRFTPSAAKQLFQLPENEEPVLLLDLGYPKDGVKPLPNHEKKRPLEEVVTYL
ncbi:MAG: nitroreductase family protein [Stomatobaculum sp.]